LIFKLISINGADPSEAKNKIIASGRSDYSCK